MKERYEALELNIVKIPVEDTIMMMSNLGNDNDHEIPPEWGGVPDQTEAVFLILPIFKEVYMKKKAIIIFIGIILICSITLFLSAFFSGKDSDKLGEDTTRTTENGQAEDLDIDSEEEKESETIGEDAGGSASEKPKERSTEDSSTDTAMDMGTEQPSENLDNEVTIPDDWEE